MITTATASAPRGMRADQRIVQENQRDLLGEYASFRFLSCRDMCSMRFLKALRPTHTGDVLCL